MSSLFNKPVLVSLDDGALMPSKAHSTDAGFDLYAPKTLESGLIRPHESLSIDTGVHIAIPKGYCGLVVSKSGLNVKHGLTSRGLIDCGYTGSIVVKLFNETGKPYIVEPGQKISQLVLTSYLDVALVEVDELAETDRGQGGFGSSGRF